MAPCTPEKADVNPSLSFGLPQTCKIRHNAQIESPVISDTMVSLVWLTTHRNSVGEFPQDDGS